MKTESHVDMGTGFLPYDQSVWKGFVSGTVRRERDNYYEAHTLLLLEAIILVNLGLQKESFRLVLGLDDNFGFFAALCIL